MPSKTEYLSLPFGDLTLLPHPLLLQVSLSWPGLACFVLCSLLGYTDLTLKSCSDQNVAGSLWAPFSTPSSILEGYTETQ